MKIITLLFPIIMLTACLTTQKETETYPGKFVKENVLDSSKKDFFDLELLPKNKEGLFPLFRVNLYEKVIKQRVKLFEKVVYTYSGHGSTRTLLKKEVIKNQFIRGKREGIETINFLKLLKNKDISVALYSSKYLKHNQFIGKYSLISNKNAILEDLNSNILSFFDDFTRKAITLVFTCDNYPKQVKTYSRKDFFELSGILNDTKKSEKGSILVKASISKDSLSPGDIFYITLDVKNTSSNLIGKIIGRSFCRYNFLNGKNFYIGSLKSGAKQRAKRAFRIPKNQRKANVFLEIHINDLFGPIKNTIIPIKIEVN